MKHHPLRITAQVFAIALVSTGLSSGATLMNENFEGNTNVFGMPTYTYTEGGAYTQPNTLGSAGNRYAHGGEPAGGSGVVFTHSYVAPTLTLTNFGFTTAQIDAGILTFNLSAQFSTYHNQNDYAVVSVQFRDAIGGNIGSPVQIGSQALVAALPTQAGATPRRGWAADTNSGIVPVGTRDVVVTMFQTKSAAQSFTDGYVDNVVLDVIPEPSSMLLSIVGGLFFLRRKR